eukprot:m.222371 g.222371  ORF g.222371 m.222371 type:complete len:181 (+) comp15134_c0_seq34:2224-2766(+)
MYHALINLLVGSCVHSLVTKQQNENILFVHVLCHECRQPPVSTDKCRTILVQALKDFEQEGARTTSVDAEWFARMGNHCSSFVHTLCQCFIEWMMTSALHQHIFGLMSWLVLKQYIVLVRVVLPHDHVAQWVAWNLAVETGRNDEYDLSGALFALSCKVSTSCFRQKAGASHGDTLNERF